MFWWTDAFAGACCVGATSSIPTRVETCEHVVAAVDVAAEGTAVRWDDAGLVRQADPYEVAFQTTVVGGVRYAPWGQVQVAVPIRGAYRQAPELADDGSGLGDVRAAVILEPVAERAGGPAVPVVTLGLRLPTGRDWTEASGPLLADVTGLPGIGVSALLSLERRTGGAFPWFAGAEVARDPGTPLRAALSAAVGYAGRATGLVTLRHERQLDLEGTARTTIGARLVVGRAIRWRGWVGFTTDVPAPFAGHRLPLVTSLNLGGAIVR